MTPEERERYMQYAQEFVGVFAPAMPPQGWEKLVCEIDGWTNFTLAELDEYDRMAKLRGHCQVADCQELAAMSDLGSSETKCHRHKYPEPDWKTFEYQRTTWR